jgi:asparagine synthase (glutamine-hydrolysing)
MIIDLTDRSNQPLLSKDGRYVLTYNGEIYNFKTLAGPNSTSDTLALVSGNPLVAEHPERLRGMFAYALWDRRESNLLLARDRFGMKPLYFAQSQTRLSFGSTTSSVGLVQGRHDIDPAALASYLRFGSVQGPSTIYEGVSEVPCGGTVTWKQGRAEHSKYWQFDDIDPGAPDMSLRATLLDSVVAHAVSDVPVAVFLSGGVDSAIIGALAVESGLDVTAFTVGFPGTELDESAEAAETARVLGLKHTIISFENFAPDFDGYFAATDQPTIDGLNTYLVSSAAAAAGFRVAMTGLGADELFCGYNLFRRIPALSALNALPSRAFRTRLFALSRGNRDKAPELAIAGRSSARLYDELRSVFTHQEVERLTGSTLPARPYTAPGRLPMDRITRLEVENYMRNTLLRDADTYSMAHSLELRTPFVDHKVLAAALQIGNGRRAMLRKRLLVDAVGSSRIAEVFGHRKRGFQLPMRQWLRGPLAPRVDALPDGPIVRSCDEGEIRRHLEAWRQGASHHSKIWALVVLDAWLRGRSHPQHPAV